MCYPVSMSSDAPAPEPKTATQKMADLVARKAAAAGGASLPGQQGRRQAERAAAANSASKSKPAMRK